MDKIWLVIKREYSVRVRKKSFIIMTLLTPLLMGLLIIGPSYLSSISQNMEMGDIKHIAFFETNNLFSSKIKNSKTLNFSKIPKEEIKNIKENMSEGPYFAFLDLSNYDSMINIFSSQQINFEIINEIESKIYSIIEKQHYQDNDIDIEKIKNTMPKIKLNPIQLNDEGVEEDANSAARSVVGILFGFSIYLFIFMYGSMVMRGVIEEKTNRIVEIIISSIKPFQLLLGKIIGIALVGLTQFILWVSLTILISQIAYFTFLNSENELLNTIFQSMQGIEMFELIFYFMFYFLGGYLLYGSFFACIGSAVDNESDTHQMVLPITIPLILSIVMIEAIIRNPDGSLALWMSIFPLSSPIAMMIRLPFEGVEYWELLLSMSLLILSFLIATWLSSRIYRIGILMYGKKNSFKELIKWIKYKG